MSLLWLNDMKQNLVLKIYQMFLFLNAFKQAANKSNPSHTRSSKKRVIQLVLVHLI